MKRPDVMHAGRVAAVWLAGGALAACSGAPPEADRDDVDPPAEEIGLADLEVVRADAAGVPTFANGKLGRIAVRGPAPAPGEEDAALRPILSSLQRALRIDPQELVLGHATSDHIGDRHYVFQQRKHGLEVIGAALVLHARDGEVYAVHGRARSDLAAPAAAAISASEAARVVTQDAALLEERSVEPDPALAYRLENGQLVLVYRVKLTGIRRDGLPVDDEVLVRAADGAIIGRIPHVHAAMSRKIYTASSGWGLPGTLVRAEGGPAVADGTVNLNYTLLGTAYDCYRDLFKRDSFDNAGAAISSAVHYGTSYANAFWTGTQLVFGDGDGALSGSLALSLDVVAHELTHGVTDHASDLIYAGESGGLNESMSDVFAAICTWYRDGYTVNANTWKVGEDVWTPGTTGDALRYLNDPRLDGASLEHYADYYAGAGVHHSSGISNLAFYLLAQGGTHPRGRSSITVTGLGMARAAQIFYRANTVTLLGNPDATFADAKIATEQAAAQLGYSSTEIAAVTAAWQAVGVGLSAPSCAHSSCTAGAALDPACNWCVEAICEVDEYCCNVAWDPTCASEVETVCNSLQCPAAAPACGHTPCALGGALSGSCDPCAASICAVDPYCCTTAWDSLCVAEVASVCGMNCG